MKNTRIHLLNISSFLKEIEILNSYFKINPRINSKVSLKKHKYFVKIIKRLKILGIVPFINLNHEI